MKELFDVYIDNNHIFCRSKHRTLKLDLQLDLVLLLTQMSKTARHKFVNGKKCHCYLDINALKLLFNEWQFTDI